MYDAYRTNYTVLPRLQPAEKPQGTPITEEQYAAAWAARAKAEGHRKAMPATVRKPPRENLLRRKRSGSAENNEQRVLAVLRNGPASAQAIGREIGATDRTASHAIKRLRMKGHEIRHVAAGSFSRYYLEEATS